MILSNPFNARAIADAAPITSWGSFGEMVTATGGFRPLYAQDAGYRPMGHDILGQNDFADDDTDEAELSVDALRAEAFAQGFEEGARVTREAMEESDAASLQLAAALQQLEPVSDGSLPAMLAVAVTRLVEQIMGEVTIDTDLLRRRCEAVAACVDDRDDRAVLHLHPEDMPLLEGVELAVKVQGDAGLGRGCVRLDTADGWIEDGPDVRLARLKMLLDDMEGKS